MNKIFALVDCNTFYASCEKLFRPDLKNKPVIVLSNNDDCVVALSKEARDAGIRRGKPVFQIMDLIKKNNVAVFSSNYALYADISARVMNTLRQFSPGVEIYSIDEAFLDLSGICDTHVCGADPVVYARKIKETIYKHTGMPVSIGIGETKTLAKLANKIGKKYQCYNGIFNIINHPNREKIFKSFLVSDLWGIGMQYSKLLYKNNINTIHDLVNQKDYWIKKNLTVKGLYTVWELRGFSCIDMVEDIPNRKNILSSKTFGQPVTTKKELKESIAYYLSLAGEKLRKDKSLCSYILIYITTNMYKAKPQYFGSTVVELKNPTSYLSELINHAHKGLDEIFKEGYEYKKAGVMLSGIISEKNIQHGLFDDIRAINKKKDIMNAIDKINMKRGKDMITTGSYGHHKNWAMRRLYKSPGYTTSWDEIATVRA